MDSLITSFSVWPMPLRKFGQKINNFSLLNLRILKGMTGLWAKSRSPEFQNLPTVPELCQTPWTGLRASLVVQYLQKFTWSETTFLPCYSPFCLYTHVKPLYITSMYFNCKVHQWVALKFLCWESQCQDWKTWIKQAFLWDFHVARHIYRCLKEPLFWNQTLPAFLYFQLSAERLCLDIPLAQTPNVFNSSNPDPTHSFLISVNDTSAL